MRTKLSQSLQPIVKHSFISHELKSIELELTY